MELPERLARLAAAAVDLIEPGMTVGLGTGSTADAVLRELGRRTAAGLIVTGVATSTRTETLARELGIPLTTLDAVDRLDVGYDGADEIDPHLDAIKGRGGALLYEKLVALSCGRYVLVATTEKCVDRLGERTPVPVEVVPFGWKQTAGRLQALGIEPVLRQNGPHPVPSPIAMREGESLGIADPFRTDNGGYILDCETGPMDDPRRLAAAIKAVSGVVEHGVFLGIASDVLLVDPDGAVQGTERNGR
jgi:ribose 5-phosphate isomerase A